MLRLSAFCACVALGATVSCAVQGWWVLAGLNLGACALNVIEVAARIRRG